MPRAHPLSDLPPTPLHWLWNPYIPAARLTLLAADPGVGKTALALDIAARLSIAAPLPPHPMHPPTPNTDAQTPNAPPFRHSSFEFRHYEPASSLFVSPDPAPDDLLLPRLTALQGNPDFIHFLPVPAAANANPAALLDALDENLPLLLDPAKSLNLQLVIIDPITAYLPLTAPDAPLYRLAQIARTHNLAILLTTRLAKNFPASLSPRHLRRALGSLAFASAARCAHLLLPNPRQTPPSPFPSPQPPSPPLVPQCLSASVPSPSPSVPQCLNASVPSSILLPIKSNLGPLPPPLAFSLSQTLDWHPQPLSDASLLRHDLLLEHAEDFLRTFLADGPKTAADVFTAAERSAISRITLTRAKASLNIRAARESFYGNWHWSLPGDTRTPAQPRLPTTAELMSILGAS